MKQLLTPAKAFFNLCFPVSCCLCGCTLTTGERQICTICRYGLARTKFWLSKSNEVSQLLWGRVDVENACSYYYLSKGTSCHSLIHQIKYRGQKKLALELGYSFGSELSKSKLYQTIDAIVPVPLHAKRQQQRGYNQSEQLALGIAQCMQAPVVSDVLVRSANTTTQTQKNRVERWVNVEHAFELRNCSRLENKHILLVDDVITTGATLEACASVLKNEAGCKVSIAALAFAK